MRAVLAVTILLGLGVLLALVPWPAVALPLLVRQLRRDFAGLFWERAQPDLRTALLTETVTRVD